MINRRKLLQSAGALLSTYSATTLASPRSTGQPLNIDLLRQPDSARVFLGDATDTAHALQRSGTNWSGAGVDVTYDPGHEKGSVRLAAPAVAVRRIHLRWNLTLNDRLLILGDAWERSYGELAWSGILPERSLPWYCLVHDGATTIGFGVEVGAAAFVFWQVDTNGISLWLDTRNGGNGVHLGDRQVSLATLVTYESQAGESAFQATRKLCRTIAGKIVLPSHRGQHPLKAIYGSNDWYYAYGKNTAEGILRDADLIRELSPAGPVRPFTVVDDGYQDLKRFPDMRKLADDIRSRNVSPGVWVRPLRAAASTRASLLLPVARYGRHAGRSTDLAFDPTVPEALDAVLSVVREARAWGYDLIKHDFTTYELLGQWGNEMGASPAVDGWSFQDRSRTSAEIISALYKDIRTAAGEDRIVIGCNTVGHLSAGIFDGQRTGDDVSGRDWERTRRMGVNTLAFRLPQNGIFFATDADCVPITADIPWSLTAQWLRAVAASGSVLLISPEPGSIGNEQKEAIRAAFSLCASSSEASVPADWISNRTPSDWTVKADHQRYDWLSTEGASPFPL
ncbi:alpha-amylase family protein [Granulicella arctica]|uniref:hypothetical protein n=1 Tax=Granulicella arctica TaxID=940613 RepID=UPI0021E07E56|nr:hypothetical protein [Granulicella arctica]